MIYLKSFNLLSRSQEESFLNTFSRTCFDSYYPMGVFSFEKALKRVDFSDITILCGGNGSGKSTLLNIIAEKLQISRETVFNKTFFFKPYVEQCRYKMDIDNPVKKRDLYSVSKISTSDDVFNHIIGVRKKNDDLGFKRDLVFAEKSNISRYGGNYNGARPRHVDMDDPESIRAFSDYVDMSKKLHRGMCVRM